MCHARRHLTANPNLSECQQVFPYIVTCVSFSSTCSFTFISFGETHCVCVCKFPYPWYGGCMTFFVFPWVARRGEPAWNDCSKWERYMYISPTMGHQSWAQIHSQDQYIFTDAQTRFMLWANARTKQIWYHSTKVDTCPIFATMSKFHNCVHSSSCIWTSI